MKTLKEGGHRLFERDPETARIVSEMLLDLEKNGLEAVRRVRREVRRVEPAEFRVEPGAGRGGYRPDRPGGRPRHRFLPGQRAAFRPGAVGDAAPAGDRDAAGRDPGTQAHPGRARRQLHPRRALPDARLRTDEHHPRQGRRREAGSGLHTAGEEDKAATRPRSTP